MASDTDSELLDVIEILVDQFADHRPDGLLDSMALGALAHAMRVLAKHNRFRIEDEFGRRVIGKMVD